MTVAAASFWRMSNLWPEAIDDRVAKTLVVAGMMGLTIMASKQLSLPETALSAYLIIFAFRNSALETLRIAVALIFAVFFAVGLLIVLVMAVSGSPALRIPLMIGLTFGCFLLGSGIKDGIIVATFGMILFEVLSGLDIIPYPDLMLRAMFWLPTVVLVPMGILIVVTLITGQFPRTLAEAELRKRMALLRRDVPRPQGTDDRMQFRTFLRRGARSLAEPLEQMRASRRYPSASLAASKLADQTGVLLALRADGRGDDDLPAPTGTVARNTHSSADATAPKAALSFDVRYALVATLAVTLCYTVFLLLKWPEIHTITITAFLISLTTKSETLHKSVLRLSGCLVGAVLSCIALFWGVANISTAAALGLMSFAFLLPAVWVALSDEVVAYVGLQIALVFLLTTVNSSGPSIDFEIVWGRLVGIVLGTIIVTVCFQTFLRDNIAKTVQQSVESLRYRNQARRVGQVGDGADLIEILDELHGLTRQIYIAQLSPYLSARDRADFADLDVQIDALATEAISKTRGYETKDYDALVEPKESYKT